LPGSHDALTFLLGAAGALGYVRRWVRPHPREIGESTPAMQGLCIVACVGSS
jgi:hypothetical protein